MNKLFYALCALLFSVSLVQAQNSGEIQGKIIDEKGQGIPFANVAVYKDGVLETGAQTDFDGKYSVSALSPGGYDVEASYLGSKQRVNGVIVSQGIVFMKDITLQQGQTLGPVVVQYQAPLVDKGNTTSGGVVTKEDIQKIATRNVTSIAATKEGVYQSDEGGGLSIKGSRGDATEYIIDGVRVSGSLKLPQDAIEQLEVVTGGVDPKYGDATGGFISITTRGPSKNFNGSIELGSSKFLDQYNYNLASVFLTGPLYTKYKNTDSATAKLGFFIAGELETNLDADPSAVGNWKVKDGTFSDLVANPLVPSATGLGFDKSAEYITYSDLENVDYKQNVADRGVSLSSKLDYKLTKNTNLQLGLSWRNFHGHSYVRTFALFNPEHNPISDQNTYRGYLRFTQRFPEKKGENGKNESIVGNAYYSIQADYTKFYSTVQDENHKMNPFEYGYIGQFNTYRSPVYIYGQDEVTGYTGYLLAGYQDTAVAFSPGNLNPDLTRYTQQYYDLSAIPPASIFDIQLGGGLLNGDFNQNLTVYSLWYNTGVPWFNYQISNSEQYALNFDAALDLKNPHAGSKISKHSIEFGFEFQQRVERGYAMNPIGLWSIARQLANAHILTLDTDNPILVVGGQSYTLEEFQATGLDFGAADSIYYNRLAIAEDQSWFDKQLREKLNAQGITTGNLDYINIDNLPLDIFSLDLFSADELLNSGNALVFYSGYDYLGNKLATDPSFNDFFTQKDDFGNYTRPIGANRPVYTAGYIQDRFNFNDIVFRVGVRVDRYDANRKVLKDKYSLYQTYSRSEVDGALNPNGDHPGNIGDDYVVYVDDPSSPAPTILGYRDGDTWFNADGEEVSDPKVIAQSSSSGTIQPYLVDPQSDIKSEDYDPNSSFEDYKPQISVMPRIAFSFPISNEENHEALFFAHYDILTQRPSTGASATPYDYFFFQENVNGVFDNPNLRPDKTVDYEIGFQQQLNRNSVIKVSAFYKELRDQIQVISVAYAYPVQYTTYGNVDFGTVKGLTLTYDLARRVKNLKLSVNYTLQFADGTGSGATSQLNLVAGGSPNLRTIIPLSYDSRHNFKFVLDYRFEGTTNGAPDWVQNAGINMTFNARSGEPFTRQADPSPTAQFGVASRSNLEGQINGSRLPWHYRTDIKVDKSFVFNVGKNDRVISANVYLWVQNLFDARNIIGVYAYTGNPEDDGYLSSAEGIEAISTQINPQAFTDLYSIKMENPDNYSVPRRIRLGVGFDF